MLSTKPTEDEDMRNFRPVMLMSVAYLAIGLSATTSAADEAIGLADVRKSFVAFDAFGVSDPWAVAGELRKYINPNESSFLGLF